MKESDRFYMEQIEAHREENEAAAHRIAKELTGRGMIYHGETIRTLQIPKIFSRQDIQRFRDIVSITYGIFEKVIRRYLNDPEYRRLFPFSGEQQELILTPRGYDSVLPIARFDIFYNEEIGNFKFCEINTDGTSAMNEDRILNETLSLNPAHQAFLKSRRVQSFELFDSWIKTFLEIYHTAPDAKEKPNVAIVDFLSGVEIEEFREFARHFRKAGLNCEVCEITELDYRNHTLFSPSGMPIDAVYRRAVTSDVIREHSRICPFLDAVKNQDVRILGAFCTQVVHNKWLFKLLHDPETQSFLSDPEIRFVKAHVPYTNLLDPARCRLDDVIREKDRWLIKPLDSYASKGVFAGRDCSPEEWSSHVREFAGNDYIYQEYCPPYRTPNIDFLEKKPAFADYANMTGLYSYNGRFAGIYSRLSAGNIISSQYNERDAASIMLCTD